MPTLSKGGEYVNVSCVREIQSCSKCGYKINGNIIEGYLEIELEYQLTLYFDRYTTTIEAIRFIHDIDPNSKDISLMRLYKAISDDRKYIIKNLLQNQVGEITSLCQQHHIKYRIN